MIEVECKVLLAQLGYATHIFNSMQRKSVMSCNLANAGNEADNVLLNLLTAGMATFERALAIQSAIGVGTLQWLNLYSFKSHSRGLPHSDRFSLPC